MPASWLIGVDVGGTKIEAMAWSPKHAVKGYSRVATPQGSPHQLVAAIRHAVCSALEDVGGSLEQIEGVGVGIPGQVQDGVVRLAVNLGLRDFPLSAILQEALGRPVWVENDVQVAARGAYVLLGRQRPLRHLAYLSIGTGVGAAILIDGEPYGGADRLAGEVGHVVVEPDGPECACGGRGCLEALVSGPALARQAAEAAGRDPHTRLRQIHPLDAHAVYQAAREGDQVALQLIERAASYLALGIQWLMLGWDPNVLVLGGGLTREGAAFLDPLRRALARLRGSSRVGRELFRMEERVVLLSPDTHVALWGAIALAQRSV